MFLVYKLAHRECRWHKATSQCADTLHLLILRVPALAGVLYTKVQPETATMYLTHVITDSQCICED